MMQKKSELTPADIKLVWYKDLWFKYLSMCKWITTTMRE